MTDKQESVWWTDERKFYLIEFGSMIIIALLMKYILGIERSIYLVLILMILLVGSSYINEKKVNE